MKIEISESKTLDPFINLSEEEKLFNSIKEDTITLRFWVNSPCVVIGKFQKEEYEVNFEIAKSLNIPIIRRFSGGGAVYHDEGVLNITIVKERNQNLFSSYIIDEAKSLTSLIGKSIEDFVGCKVSVNERNGIFVSGKKIAGSSVAVGKNFLYHISILVEANLELLNEILKGLPYEENEKRYVKSVKSEVINLKDINPNVNVRNLREILKEDLFKSLTKLNQE